VVGHADVWERDVLDRIIRDGLRNRKPSDDRPRNDVGRFLGFLGLMKITREGDWVPTDRLLNLLVVLREYDANRGKAKKVKWCIERGRALSQTAPFSVVIRRRTRRASSKNE
jgi:hypothetical protein